MASPNHKGASGAGCRGPRRWGPGISGKQTSGRSTVGSLYRLLPANAVCSRAVCGVVTALVLLYNLCVWWNIYELFALVFIKRTYHEFILKSSPISSCFCWYFYIPALSFWPNFWRQRSLCGQAASRQNSNTSSLMTCFFRMEIVLHIISTVV